ncbi:MAG: hypothetical protein RLZZ453_135 [Chlamydiota bacterium]|jgi:hypothetical protein
MRFMDILQMGLICANGAILANTLQLEIFEVEDLAKHIEEDSRSLCEAFSSLDPKAIEERLTSVEYDLSLLYALDCLQEEAVSTLIPKLQASQEEIAELGNKVDMDSQVNALWEESVEAFSLSLAQNAVELAVLPPSTFSEEAVICIRTRNSSPTLFYPRQHNRPALFGKLSRAPISLIRSSRDDDTQYNAKGGFRGSFGNGEFEIKPYAEVEIRKKDGEYVKGSIERQESGRYNYDIHGEKDTIDDHKRD